MMDIKELLNSDNPLESLKTELSKINEEISKTQKYIDDAEDFANFVRGSYDSDIYKMNNKIIQEFSDELEELLSQKAQLENAIADIQVNGVAAQISESKGVGNSNNADIKSGVSSNIRPTITCEWSEHRAFEDNKTYSVSEFDSIMKKSDSEWLENRQKEIEQYGGREAAANADNTLYQGYLKTKFTINMPDGSRITERQDIGVGYGGVINFLKQIPEYPYDDIVKILEADIKNEFFNNPELSKPSSISKITISPLKEPKNGVVAMAAVTVDNTITINSITLREKQDGSGLYVKMPQKRTVDGKYIDVAHPLNSETRKNLNERIISMYNSGKHSFINQAYEAKKDSPKISAQNCVKYKPNPDNPSNSIARLDVVVSDFVVHNAKIVNVQNDKQKLYLPSYKGSDGEFHSIVTPHNSEANKKLNEAALKEFNTEYKFKRASDIEVQALKDAGIQIQTTKSDSGKTLVKFNAKNENAVNNTLNAVIQKQSVAPAMS